MTGASLGYSGNYADLLLYNVGLTGNWWSSTVNSTSTGYRLNTHYYTDAITPQNSSNKYDGLAVRCLPNPGPTYSLPMGMRIMRVGVRILEAIHYRMSIRAATPGLLVGFTARR